MATKNELIELISNHMNYLPKKDVSDAVNLVLEYMQKQLTNGNRIEIRGFGSFSIRNRIVPSVSKSCKVIHYKMAKGCLKAVNANHEYTYGYRFTK